MAGIGPAQAPLARQIRHARGGDERVVGAGALDQRGVDPAQQAGRLIGERGGGDERRSHERRASRRLDAVAHDVADGQHRGVVGPVGHQVEVPADPLFGGGQERRGHLQAGTFGQLRRRQRVADRAQILQLVLGGLERAVQRARSSSRTFTSWRRRAIRVSWRCSRRPISRRSRSRAAASECSRRTSSLSFSGSRITAHAQHDLERQPPFRARPHHVRRRTALSTGRGDLAPPRAQMSSGPRSTMRPSDLLGQRRPEQVRRSDRATLSVVKIELLYFDGCPSHEAFVPRLQRAARAGGRGRAGRAAPRGVRRGRPARALPRAHRRCASTASTSTRAPADRTDYGLKCRLYPTGEGLRGAPPDEWVLERPAARRPTRRADPALHVRARAHGAARGGQDRGAGGAQRRAVRRGRPPRHGRGRGADLGASAARRRAVAEPVEAICGLYRRFGYDLLLVTATVESDEDLRARPRRDRRRRACRRAPGRGARDAAPAHHRARARHLHRARRARRRRGAAEPGDRRPGRRSRSRSAPRANGPRRSPSGSATRGRRSCGRALRPRVAAAAPSTALAAPRDTGGRWRRATTSWCGRASTRSCAATGTRSPRSWTRAWSGCGTSPATGTATTAARCWPRCSSASARASSPASTPSSRSTSASSSRSPARGSTEWGLPGGQACMVVTVRDGRIVRMQDYPNRAAALAGAGLPPEPAGGRSAELAGDRRRCNPDAPAGAHRSTEVIRSGDAAELEQLLREHPELATARLGDPRAGSRARCCTSSPTGRGTSRRPAAKIARAGRRGRRRQRALHRPAHRDAAALGGQQRRPRGARRAARRRRRHRGRRRRDRRRHADGRRGRLRAMEGRPAAAGTRRAHEPLAGRRARPRRPRPRRARADPAGAGGPRQRAVVRRARRPAQTAELLLRRGANPDWVGHDGLTAAEAAERSEAHELRGLVARAGRKQDAPGSSPPV